MTSSLLLLSGVLLSAAAQVLLKLGAISGEPGARALAWGFARWQILAGAVLYCVAFLVYVRVLARVDLSYASPVMVGGVTLCVLAAGAFLGESVGATRILGSALILAGILVLSLDAG